jgi:hypothetical protein
MQAWPLLYSIIVSPRLYVHSFIQSFLAMALPALWTAPHPSVQDQIRSLNIGKLPRHLAFSFDTGGISDDSIPLLINQVAKLVQWAHEFGISCISVYDSKGSEKQKTKLSDFSHIFLNLFFLILSLLFV